MDDQQPNHSSTPAEIIDYYDSHLNLTLRELSDMTGRSIAYLKGLLLQERRTHRLLAGALLFAGGFLAGILIIGLGLY
jgi:ubiquinone biosynthesis protein